MKMFNKLDILREFIKEYKESILSLVNTTKNYF